MEHHSVSWNKHRVRLSASPQRPVFHTASRSLPVHSVVRTLTVLEKLAFSSSPLSLAEISNDLRLPPSTTHRLLATLMWMGFVSQDKRTEHYQATLKLFNLGSVVLSRFNLSEKLLPSMRRIADQIGESVSLVVREGMEGVLLERIEGTQGVQIFSKYRRVSLYCTAAGKAILAGFDSKGFEDFLARTTFKSLTTNTITSPAALRLEIEKVRRMGFAVDDEEMEKGARCVAVPLTLTNDTVAAVSVSGLAPRMMPKRIREIAVVMKREIGGVGFVTSFSQKSN